jgi:hypothetical protein
MKGACSGARDFGFEIMATTTGPVGFTAAVYLMYREVFDRTPEYSELPPLVADLEVAETSSFLCQLNTELRLAVREREALAKVQTEWAAGLLDDETIQRLKERFGREHLADRPLFHAPQILNVLRLVIEHSRGTTNPRTDDAARYKLGTACLMMNDLFLTQEEHLGISSGTTDSRMLALITQMLEVSEVINSSAISHIVYRSRIMFDVLLSQDNVVQRIRRECGGFDFKQEFGRIVGMSVSHWLFLLFGFCSYLMAYIGQDGSRNLEYLAIDPTKYRGESKITPQELDIVLSTVSASFADFKNLLAEKRLADWRFDFMPFRSKPLIEFAANKFYCADIGFLVEKMHSGVYWAINDGLDRRERPKLFSAWGILFEEYVNWFLGGCRFKQDLLFWPAPKWADDGECFDGAFTADARFMPMEYKGGFLRIEARYSADPTAFETDLDLKITKGCEQLARKIQQLFNRKAGKRRQLRDVPLEHVTRIIPVLVVQDHILRSPLINWLLNRKFNQLLDRNQLRDGVAVDPLNVVNIHELETMAESAEGGTFDLFHGLQLRCFRDPEMFSDLQNFLLTIPGYGQGKSERIQAILDEQWKEIQNYIFGARAGTDESVSAAATTP